MPSGKMHSLLNRQLKRAFGESFEVPPQWSGFIEMVNSAYHESDMDRNMLERSLDFSSQELLQANSEMRAIFEAVPDIFFRIDVSGKILDCKAGDTADLLISRPNMIGKKIDDIPLAPVADKFRKALEDIRRRQAPVSFEYSLILHDTEKFCEARLIPLLDNQAVVVIRDVTDLKDVESALKKSEEIYTRLVNAIPDIIVLADLQGRINFVNEYTLQISGYRRDEMEGRNVLAFVSPADHARVIQNSIDMLERRIGPEEFHLVMKDGREIPFEVNGDVLRAEDGAPFGVVHVCRDISERKQAGEALRENEERFRLITDNMQDTVWLMDMNLRATWISPSVEQKRGYTLQELRDIPLERHLTPESHQLASELIAKNLTPERLADPREDISVEAEFEYINKNGSTMWADTVISLLRDGQGAPSGFLGLARDTTERRKMEEALRQSEKKFRLITERITDIVWIADMNLRTLYVSPSIEKVLGFTQEERLMQSVVQQLTPESVLIAYDTMTQELALEEQGRADPQRNINLVLEYYHKNGSTRWMETVVSLVRNQQGAVSELYGVSRNITERRRAEQELQDSEAKLQAVFNQIDTGIMIISADTQTILEMNQRAAEMSGFEREKVIGQICHQLLCPAQRNQCPVKHLGQKIDQSERKLLCADGSQKDILKTVHPIVIKGQNCYLESFVDISDRKRAEAGLQAAHAELEHRVKERTRALTAANAELKELLQKQDVNIDLAKNILAMINYRPCPHNMVSDDIDLYFHAYYLPCYAEGGDHFFIKKFFQRHAGVHKTTLSLKDQSGHEVSCILRSIITDLVHNALLVNMPDQPLEKIIAQLNKEICDLPFFGDDNFFTTVNAEISHADMKMRYVSAGHPSFLFIRQRDVLCLPSLDGPGRSLPIGIQPSADFTGDDLQLRPGDKLIFFTDGLTDIPHMSGQDFLNADHLKAMAADIVRDQPDIPVSILMARLFKRITGREGDSLHLSRSFDDDVTMLGMELETVRPEYEDEIHPANLDEVDRAVTLLFQKISEEWGEKGFKGPESRLRMVLEEAVVNAWTHGNRENPDKKIVIRRRYGNDAVLEVIDEGDGFDFKTFYDPTSKENLLNPRGRGNFIMRLFTEDTQWRDGGRHLTAYFSREEKNEHTVRSLSGFNLWRRHKKN